MYIQYHNGFVQCFYCFLRSSLQVSQLDGVYSVQEAQFWTLCSEVYIGGVKLEVAQDADIKYIQSQTHNIFTAVCITLCHLQYNIIYITARKY